MKLSKIKSNPNNPRLIKDDKFLKLVQSIKDFPKMMELRPIVVDETFTALGGNMRLAALNELKYKEIPDEWVRLTKDLTEDQKKEFIIKDNVGFGEWDWNMIANEWDSDQLVEWGLDLPIREDKKDLSDSIEAQFKIEIDCGDEKKQKELFIEFTNRGLSCRILAL